MGGLEVIVGSMFSGKTEELIRRLRRVEFARQKLQVFKPKIDDRYHGTDITSHNQNAFPAVAVEKSIDILRQVQKDTQVVGIDEGQFFDETLVDVVETLADRGVRVLVAGLDTDWRGEPFEPIPTLMAMAEIVTKQSAVCVVCGQPAHRTQRVFASQNDQESGAFTENKILVGAQNFYEARCRRHFKPEILPRFQLKENELERVTRDSIS